MQTDATVLAVSIPEAARRLGVSTRTVATLIARKELQSKRIGRRRLVTVDALQQFLRSDHVTTTAGISKLDRTE
ncbi:MAG TPA: helix-turn-helix domain-containing protein [Terriglobales bacterium]|nr:helix-turn-helix domain-containing protein [Terriglobales bacterium]